MHQKAARNEACLRQKPEDPAFWSPYKQDVERIIHSKAFRRYTDKTQVVYLVENDHLTHRSLHVQLVSSYARGLAELLGLNVHLVEAISLGHDVGHPPFGHEGEGYLSELMIELGLGAFSHAHQSCRLFSEIEPLNLTFCVLDGFLCHDGGMRQARCEPWFEKRWQDYFAECKMRQAEPEKDFRPATLEGALVKMCDTISYIGKDIEDAICLGMICREDVPQTFLGVVNREILERAAKEIVEASRGQEAIILSDELFEALKVLRAFNFERIYKNPRLKVESQKIRSAYRYMFDMLFEDMRRQEESYVWRHFLHSKGEMYRRTTKDAQKVCDFIAGMTDHYFLATFEKLVVPQKILL